VSSVLWAAGTFGGRGSVGIDEPGLRAQSHIEAPEKTQQNQAITTCK
jgi:hypothetical protein